MSSLLLGACAGSAPADPAEPALTPPAPSVAAPASKPTAEAPPRLPARPLAAAPPSVVIAAVGDVMLDREVESLIAERGAGYPWARVTPLFEGADLVLANLEGVLTTRGAAATKRYTFRTDPALSGTLTAAGIDLVSLANNHTTDFGDIGLEDTLATLDALAIGHFGAGPDAPTARAPLVRTVDGLSVAFLGYADIGNTRFAQDKRAGVAYADLDAMRNDIASAQGEYDLVIVTLHTGVEYSDDPSMHQRQLAHAAVEAGADLVIGHHPHVLQGWERVGDALILYSLGNFVFDLDEDDLTALGVGPFLTAVAVVELSPGVPPDLEVRPAFIDPLENRPRPASAEEAAAVRSRMAELAGE